MKTVMVCPSCHRERTAEVTNRLYTANEPGNPHPGFDISRIKCLSCLAEGVLHREPTPAVHPRTK